MPTTPKEAAATVEVMPPTEKRTTTRRVAKRASKKKASKKKRASKAGGKKTRDETVAWAAKHMKSDPAVTMAELKKLGKPEGHNVYPLIIGLALKKLGKPGARGAGGKKRKVTRKKTAARRGPGRPRKSPGRSRRGPGRPRKVTDPADAIRAVMDRMKQLERDHDAMGKALGRIAEIATRY